MGYSRDDIDKKELDFEISAKANGEHIQVIYHVQNEKIVFEKFLSREGNPLFKDKGKEHHFYTSWEKMRNAINQYVETTYKLYPEAEGSKITVHIEFCHLDGHMPHTKEGDGYIFRVSSSNGTWFDMRKIQEEVAQAVNIFSERKLNKQHIYTVIQFLDKDEAAVSLSLKDLEQPENKLNNLLERKFRCCPIIQSLFEKEIRAEGFVANWKPDEVIRQKYNNLTHNNHKHGLDFMHPLFKYKFEEQREVNDATVKEVLNNKGLTFDEKVQELVKHILYSQVREDKSRSLMRERNTDTLSAAIGLLGCFTATDVCSIRDFAEYQKKKEQIIEEKKEGGKAIKRTKEIELIDAMQKKVEPYIKYWLEENDPVLEKAHVEVMAMTISNRYIKSHILPLLKSTLEERSLTDIQASSLTKLFDKQFQSTSMAFFAPVMQSEQGTVNSDQKLAESILSSGP